MKRSSMIPLSVLALALLVAALALTGNVADAQQPKSFFPLSDFGPLDSPANIQATFVKAVRQLRESDGGVLIVPASAWRMMKPISLQGLVREPAPPAETRRWRDGAGVTVVAVDAKQAIGKVGKDARSDQTFLHFEIRKEDQPLNPLRHLP